MLRFLSRRRRPPMPEFCDVALPVPLDTAFTYHLSGEVEPVVGGRVLVPFRQQRMSGIVVGVHDRKPSVKTKDVLTVLDTTPVLDDQLLRLGKWIADYYLAPLGEVFRTMLPLTAEFKRAIGYRITEEGQMALHLAGMAGSSARSHKTPEEQLVEYRVLNYLADRELVREETLRSATRANNSLLTGMLRKKWISREDFSGQRDAARTVKVALLKTADGKLNDNQRLVIETLAAAAADLHQVFGEEVAILHSALSDQERAEQWHRIKRGEARMVVGTRSAVFAPVADLALIIVDEEQDSSYKQEGVPRYHARDVAVMRAKMAGAVVVLGSATPSLESYFNATQNKYALIELPDRVEQRPLPQVEIIDMRQEFQETGHEQVISRKLAQAIGERLERHEQIMVLLNRRGYSPVVLCRACGKTLECKNCAIALTHHKRARKMECHYCGYTAPVPQHCVHCGSEYVYFLGTGSEKLEELLHGMFPQARIGRLDRDTVRGREDFERVLGALHEGELDLLVGTQMIAKGHDIHGVTLVGVVGADMALGMPDFRAAERTFQLLTQVAGRAGRGSTPGTVVLQTYFPDHYAVQYAAQHDFAGFYDKELRFRSWMHYPPYSALANVLVRSGKLDEALRWSGVLGQWFEKTRHEGVRVLGPAAAPILRLKKDYRYHFVLKSPSREKLNGMLRAMLKDAVSEKLPRTQVIVDVDALWLM